MAFKPIDKIKIGSWIYTSIEHGNCSGVFEKRTLVKVIGITERGYDIEDECGNRMYEIGWII